MDEKQLRLALENASDEAKSVVGYYPVRFLLMLQEKGAIRTAEELIMRPQVTEGLTRLVIEGRIDLSVEAVVIEGPFHRLFSDEVISMARDRLDELKYDYTEWPG